MRFNCDKVVILGTFALSGCIITGTDVDGPGTAAETDAVGETEETTPMGLDDDGADEDSADENDDATGGEGTDGEDSDIDRPDRSREFLSDEDLELLIEAGAVIYPGSNPPDISGVFDVTTGAVIYHDREDIVGTATCYYMWTLEATADDEVYTSSSESYFNCSGSSEGNGVFISGDGSCFTIYGLTEGDREGCLYELSGITSGCLTEDGIDGMNSASLAGPLESDVPNSCETLISDGLIGDEGEVAVIEHTVVTRVE